VQDRWKEEDRSDIEDMKLLSQGESVRTFRCNGLERTLTRFQVVRSAHAGRQGRVASLNSYTVRQRLNLVPSSFAFELLLPHILGEDTQSASSVCVCRAAVLGIDTARGPPDESC